MQTALEILRTFRRLGVAPVNTQSRRQHCAQSQYGYTLAVRGSYKEALRFTLNYYAANMRLIRQ